MQHMFGYEQGNSTRRAHDTGRPGFQAAAACTQEPSTSHEGSGTLSMAVDRAASAPPLYPVSSGKRPRLAAARATLSSLERAALSLFKTDSAGDSG